MAKFRKIHCTTCREDVMARRTLYKEVRPYVGSEFGMQPIWVCDRCMSYVGCHVKTRDKFKPLGTLAGKEMREIRSEIHRVLDALWKSRRTSRGEIYKIMTGRLGYEFHTGEIRTMEQAENVLQVARDVSEYIRERHKQ